MKKMILSTLFSVTLLMGTTGTFADTITPEEPTTPPSGEVTPPTDGGDQPTDPVLPPNIGDSGTGGDTGTTTPPDTGDSGTGGGDTGTPTPPDTGDSGTGGGDTGIPTPPDTGDSGTGGDTGTPTPPDTGDTGTTTPPDTGNNGAGGNTGTTTPPNTGNDGTGGNTGATTPPTNGNSGGQTTTPPTTNVGINSDGTINQSGNAIQTTSIQTNNVNELTHIPTASTPVETDTGEKIVSVIDGVPYKQTEQGLTPVAAKVTKLPSGNIAVKGSDGQVKVLPKTGEKAISAIVTLIGGILTSTSGWFFWKKRRV
ncbi:LPXTG cell wall anchor domain-containing protein [Enterococcus faecium]|uniref:LPXTG cell wall anchor domain-containing protein n=1 Tax=Enterococcus faecium TaxID=1352 RepID=UPI00191488C9|nr:LPXTG cell wall anchor domain-containing protein [Enterococcus faecium]MBK5028543.1 LPXTG cell wall anchor domain-containing protein [Enterococcus faecium]MBK5039246.1 LPXTG cell wall anchor domain-containing protein [Enterococcus faecium]MBK5044187.1 LPXTG cell wall anchor domain-containing protein [Enterococcus faecium]MBK5069110.1 LPXTG cell wall anchor domain-containing protein [Enterococcus faecium]MBK5132612.1 LPXTG cell wall anchor domain-containing protein [Enterococcus faecium]